MASRRSTLRCASCRATYWSDDAHRCPPAKPRRWRKIHPHEYTLRMGPVTIEVSRWYSAVTSRTGGADEWGWAALIGSTRFLRGHHVGKGAPRAQCQADAIAGVERWRDGIR